MRFTENDIVSCVSRFNGKHGRLQGGKMRQFPSRFRSRFSMRVIENNNYNGTKILMYKLMQNTILYEKNGGHFKFTERDTLTSDKPQNAFLISR